MADPTPNVTITLTGEAIQRLIDADPSGILIAEIRVATAHQIARALVPQMLHSNFSPEIKLELQKLVNDDVLMKEAVDRKFKSLTRSLRDTTKSRAHQLPAELVGLASTQPMREIIRIVEEKFMLMDVPRRVEKYIDIKVKEAEDKISSMIDNTINRQLPFTIEDEVNKRLREIATAINTKSQETPNG